MSDLFLFNSPPRSGNVFLTLLFSMFIGGPVTKCLETEKYSDKSQKQAVFFRNPYESIPSTVVKSRVDCGIGINHNDIGDLKNNIQVCAKEYLHAIKEAKKNASNLYIGKSENMMNSPLSAIKDIALFFNLKINENHGLNDSQIIDYIRHQMNNTQKTRVDKDGITIIETLMSSHDGHMPREKSEDRVFLDNLIQTSDLDIVTQCYNEYISLELTDTSKGQRWAY